jgi:hypothetical protein
MDLFQSSSSVPVPRPLDQPTFATYLILRRALGEIVARITQHFQRLDGGGGYKDVEVLDGQIRALRESLPPAFSIDSPNEEWDDSESWTPAPTWTALMAQECWYLPVHRYYIQTRQAWKKDFPDFFETLLGSSFREFVGRRVEG